MQSIQGENIQGENFSVRIFEDQVFVTKTFTRSFYIPEDIRYPKLRASKCGRYIYVYSYGDPLKSESEDFGMWIDTFTNRTQRIQTNGIPLSNGMIYTNFTIRKPSGEIIDTLLKDEVPIITEKYLIFPTYIYDYWTHKIITESERKLNNKF